MQENDLQLFVYGTLKRGFANHRRFCRGAVFVTEARVEGRLYQLPPGYPGLVIPEANVLAEGTADLQADLKLQRQMVHERECKEPIKETNHEAWGEVFSFSRLQALREIDRLENFRPDGAGLYRRVLAEVSPPLSLPRPAPLVVWLYVVDEPGGGARLLPQGVWPEV